VRRAGPGVIAGVIQLNIRIAIGTRPSSVASLSVQIDNTVSQTDVTLSIR
jgi:hypothetical protein